MADRVDAIVLGASPAGLTAAITLARAARRVVVFEKPLGIENVRLLSLPIARLALGAMPQDASLMRAITTVRRVSTHKKHWAASEAGTPTADGADLVSVEMDDFLNALGKLAEGAGAHRRGGFGGLLVEESGRVRGVKTDDGASVFAPITIVAEGEDSASAQALAPRENALVSQEIITSHETWRVGEAHINGHLGAPAKQGALTLISGELLGGLPNALAWIFPGTETMTLGAQIPREASETAHVSIDECLNRVLTHPAFSRLFKGGRREARVCVVRRRGGLSDLRRLFGAGWMIAGEAAGLRDVRHPYELRMELTSGACAGEAALKALEVGDAGAMTLGLYKRMLMDSYVWPELAAAEEEVSRREANLDLDAYYPELFARRLALDLKAGEEARTEVRREFSDQMLTERPLWEILKAGVSGFRVLG